MSAVSRYNAEELGDMTKNDISDLVGYNEGNKLYTEISNEKSGECWHVSK